MLLTIDVGNTNIKLALYEDNMRIAFEMLDTKPIDFKSFILSFLYKSNIREDKLDDAILSCVVPGLFEPIVIALQAILKKNPYVIDMNHHYGIEVSDKVTDKVGSDLLTMCAYAYQTNQRELIVVSLGTATALVHVSADGVCDGFTLAPGFKSMASAMFSNAAQLPDFIPSEQKGFTATNTINAMNIGVYNGYVGMVRYLINGIKSELTSFPLVVGCGGAGKDVAKYISEFESYDPDLVTTGLNYIYNRYIKNE